MKSTEVTELRESREVDAILVSEEFIGDTMMPVPERNFSKSPQMSDEGIEPDSHGRKLTVTRSWSLESATRADDDPTREEQIWERKTTKHRVTRCCSSDSAVLSDEEQVKGWESLIIYDSVDHDETCEGKPRYWRTPSVVVSDYSDHSYVDEKYERSDPELEKSEGIASGTNSRASSCSCLDCDDAREFDDLANSRENRLLTVCGRRRHSDSCCACLDSNADISNGRSRDPASRRNSCLGSPTSYRYKQHDESAPAYYQSAEQPTKATNAPITSRRRSDDGKRSIELLDIPPFRKISDCSTNSSLSGDDFDVTELQPLKRAQISRTAAILVTVKYLFYLMSSCRPL